MDLISNQPEPHPDKVIIKVSASSLQELDSCEQAFVFSQFLRLMTLSVPDYFTKGGEFHKILEHYYGARILGRKDLTNIRDEAIEASRARALKDPNLEINISEECIKLFERYFENYKHEQWIPLAVESKFATSLYDSESVQIILVGKIDLIAKSEYYEKFLVDHKTGAKNDKQSSMDTQFNAYPYATGLSTIYRNYAGFTKEGTFSRDSYNYTKEQLEEWKDEVVFKILRLHNDVQSFGAGPNFPKRRSNCSRCRFKHICESEPRMREMKIKQLYVRKPEEIIE